MRNSKTKAMLELLLLDQIETNGVSISDVCDLEFYPGSILVRAEVKQNATAALSALINTGNLRLTVGGNMSVANLTGEMAILSSSHIMICDMLAASRLNSPIMLDRCFIS